MSERVVVELVDFMNNNTIKSSHLIDDSALKPLDLIKKLKQQFGKKQFSQNFNQIDTINLPAGRCFDLVISDDYNKIIVADGHYLNVYNRPLSVETLTLLFRVKYNDSELFCMKLVKEKGMEYIYISCKENFIIKIRVSDLMNNSGELPICWKSTCQLANICKVDLCMGKVYVIQYFSPEIVVLDGESGQLIVENDLPQIQKAYGIHFLSEREMLVSQLGCLELFEKKQDGKWISIRPNRSTAFALYAIFYEVATQLIYVGDCKSIYIVALEDFSIVKQQVVSFSTFGMVVDPKSGLFYACTDGKFVSVYQ